MKKLFVVFVVIAIVSAVLFACSVAAYGVKDGNYGVSIGIAPFEIDSSTGFGLGFERCVMYLTGMGNIRDVIPFPRTVKNCDL